MVLVSPADHAQHVKERAVRENVTQGVMDSPDEKSADSVNMAVMVDRLIQETRRQKSGPTAGENSSANSKREKSSANSRQELVLHRPVRSCLGRDVPLRRHYKRANQHRSTSPTAKCIDKIVDVPITVKHQAPTIQTAQKQRLRKSRRP